MPITIIERPEVLTEASRIASDPPLLIRSNAVRLLTHELRRYCKREVSGRSFLIAGHRGAGKTTLALNACQEIIKESAEERFPLRPLLVMLQGPNLLPNEEDELPVVAEDGEKPGGGPRKITPMENVLRQITLGLYRALAREISQAFRNHVMGLAAGFESITSIPQSELIEFAAALELELDEYPGKSRLRQFWQTAGVLETGVLRPRPLGLSAAKRTLSPLERLAALFPRSTAVVSAPETMKPVRPSDQGLRELVALCSACEAYRRISGTFTSKQEDKRGAKATEERKIEAELKGKEILGPMMPVLVGALAGTGVFAANVATGPQAAFAGASAAIASAFALKYASSRFRERSATREDLFLPDLSVATLDRVLPVLIDRVQAAGLAPIFIIDELDKVERLSIRIPEMVRRLKKLVAEHAFFCFLTDRTYYEEMRERELKKPYSIEHTYFTHQLFIIFRHSELHNFLGEVLRPPDAPPDLAEPAAPGVATVIISSAEREAQNLIKLERGDCAVLPFVLLYAARMHSIDLRRELVQIRTADGNVTLKPGAIQSIRRYRLELQMQVAIETLLDEGDMESELDRHPEFRRLAHDALYYLAERWEDANNELDLDSKDALAQFKEYLCSRMATDPKAPDKTSSWHFLRSSSAAINGSDLQPPAITDADLGFLWTRVRDLAVQLSLPDALLTHARLRGLRATPFPEVVLNAVSPDPLLKRLGSSEHRYRWCWYPSGRRIHVPVSAGARGAKKKAPSWNQHVDFIRTFAKALSSVTRDGATFADLGTNLNIISTSPPWKIVEDAMNRLEKLATKTTYAGQDDDADTVGQFDALLKRSAPTIAYAICAARVLEVRRKPKAVADMAHRLTTISSGLSLRSASEPNVAEWMKELFQQVRSRFSVEESPLLPPVNDKNGIEQWKKWVRTHVARIGLALRGRGAFKDLTDIRKRAWDYWYTRFTNRDFVPVSLDSLMCAHRGFGPGSYFTVPLEEMTVQKWSGAFYSAFNIEPITDSEEKPPLWLALAALSHLGFADRVATLRERSAKGDQILGNQELSDRWKDAILKWPLDFTILTLKRSALVLRRGEPALVGVWKPDPAFPVLTLSRPQAEALLSSERLRDLNGFLFPEVIIFDLTGPQLSPAEGAPAKPTELQLPPDSLEGAFMTAVPFKPVMPVNIPIVVPADLSPLPAGYLCIINPKNSEELFRSLTQQEEVAARNLPSSPSAIS
jgi:hypothetical protein